MVATDRTNSFVLVLYVVVLYSTCTLVSIKSSYPCGATLLPNFTTTTSLHHPSTTYKKSQRRQE